MIQTPRNILLRFWYLSPMERREILQSLGLLEEEDVEIAEDKRYDRAIVSASTRGLIRQLVHGIEQALN